MEKYPVQKPLNKFFIFGFVAKFKPILIANPPKTFFLSQLLEKPLMTDLNTQTAPRIPLNEIIAQLHELKGLGSRHLDALTEHLTNVQNGTADLSNDLPFDFVDDKVQATPIVYHPLIKGMVVNKADTKNPFNAPHWQVPYVGISRFMGVFLPSFKQVMQANPTAYLDSDQLKVLVYECEMVLMGLNTELALPINEQTNLFGVKLYNDTAHYPIQKVILHLLKDWANWVDCEKVTPYIPKAQLDNLIADQQKMLVERQLHADNTGEPVNYDGLDLTDYENYPLYSHPIYWLLYFFGMDDSLAENYFNRHRGGLGFKEQAEFVLTLFNPFLKNPLLADTYVENSPTDLSLQSFLDHNSYEKENDFYQLPALIQAQTAYIVLNNQNFYGQRKGAVEQAINEYNRQIFQGILWALALRLESQITQKSRVLPIIVSTQESPNQMKVPKFDYVFHDMNVLGQNMNLNTHNIDSPLSPNASPLTVDYMAGVYKALLPSYPVADFDPKDRHKFCPFVQALANNHTPALTVGHLLSQLFKKK